MDISGYRSQLTVSALFCDKVRARQAEKVVSDLGYKVYGSSSEEEFLQKFQNQPTHLVVFQTQALLSSFELFLKRVIESSQDAHFVVCGLPSEQSDLYQLARMGLSAFVKLDDDFEHSLAWGLDQASERLLLQFQNQQMVNENKNLQQQKAAMESALQEICSSLVLSELEGKLIKCSSKEELMQNIMQELLVDFEGRCKIVFLKHLHSIRSFVVTHSLGLAFDSVRGVGFKLESEESKDIYKYLSRDLGFESLSRLMREGFTVESYRFLPVLLEDELDGLLVFFQGDLHKVDSLAVKNKWIYFLQFYENFHLKKRIISLEVKDTVSQFYTLEQFSLKLNDEMQKARKLKRPVSIIRFSIDQFAQVEEQMGEAVRDHMISSLATIIRKINRSQDVLCRTGLNEFTLILPYVEARGAAIKAERLRKVIESTIIPEFERPFSISCGVNEFPSLAGTPQALSKGATQALAQVASRGGNRVCLAKAVDNYSPEYPVGEG